MTKKEQFVDESAVGDEQFGVAGELDHPIVKIDVGREIRFDVAFRGGLLHLFDARAQLSHVLRCRRPREPPADVSYWDWLSRSRRIFTRCPHRS